MSTPVTGEVVPAVQSQPEPYIHHAQQAALGGGRRTIVLAVCCSALFMVGLDNTIVNVGLPSIGASLHTEVSGLQWTVAGYTIVLASLLMFSGAAADRIGRRTIFQVGLSRHGVTFRYQDRKSKSHTARRRPRKLAIQ